jgi:membrane dipeptidase
VLGRRHFLKSALGTTALGFAQPAFGRRDAQAVGTAPRASPIIDGLGEIHLDYPPALLDEIRASGLRGCVVTVGNPALQGADAFGDVKAEVEAYDRHVAAHPSRLSKAVSAPDLDRAIETGTIGLVYYTQNASPIGDDTGRLQALHDLGVRIVQLTYNTRNLLGDGCLERTNAGLSRFGVDVVARMNELGMLVDLSHCGEATTLDGIAFSKAPASINHAGCKAVHDHPRNKSDQALRALAEKGGVVGIFQINPYLGPKERNNLGDYLAHVDHAVKVAGIDHVGIGSDREHRRIPDTPEEKQKLIDELSRLRPVTASSFRWPFFIGELNHPRRMETIAEGLSRRGYAAAAVDKILGGNFQRLFRETLRPP